MSACEKRQTAGDERLREEQTALTTSCSSVCSAASSTTRPRGGLRTASRARNPMVSPPLGLELSLIRRRRRRDFQAKTWSRPPGR